MEASPDRRLVTELLRQWGGGDRQALDQLMPFVYDQLRKVASRCLGAERPDQTLVTTALVHEAYLRLADSDLPLEDRIHFFAVSAGILRRIATTMASSNGTLTTPPPRFSRLFALAWSTSDGSRRGQFWSGEALEGFVQVRMAKAWLRRELTSTG